jgi:hypothetical protein
MLKNTMVHPGNYGNPIIGISAYHVYSAMISRNMQLGLIMRAR